MTPDAVERPRVTPTHIVRMSRAEFFGPCAKPGTIVYVAYYGTKLVGAFARLDHAERALLREHKLDRLERPQ